MVCGRNFWRRVRTVSLAPGAGTGWAEQKRLLTETLLGSASTTSYIRPLEAAELSQTQGNGVRALFVWGSSHVQLPGLEALGFCLAAAGKWAWQWLTRRAAFGELLQGPDELLSCSWKAQQRFLWFDFRDCFQPWSKEVIKYKEDVVMRFRWGLLCL